MFNQGMAGGIAEFRLPFIEAHSMEAEPHTSYWKMLSHYFSPYFRLKSISFLFIVITFICLVIPQFLFPLGSLQPKLFSYRQIPGVYLSPTEVKHVNHWAIYKAFTTLFFHISYTHWLGNLIGILLNLFTMEFCWLPSIFIMLLGGVVTGAWCCLVLNNIMMGFSAVIACSVGMYVGMFIGNWNHIRTHHSSMMTVWGINCLFLFLLLFSHDPRATLVHFIGLGIGVVYGLAWIPKLNPDRCEILTGTVCKVLSVIITILPFVIILLSPIGLPMAGSQMMGGPGILNRQMPLNVMPSQQMPSLIPNQNQFQNPYQTAMYQNSPYTNSLQTPFQMMFPS